MSRSLLIGALAGILLTFDGLAFTMSRIALLDVFQATFLVAAVAALVADRDHHRHKLADAIEAKGWTDLRGEFGPVLWWRPWRWIAGVLFGLAVATKWNSLFALAVFGIVWIELLGLVAIGLAAGFAVGYATAEGLSAAFAARNGFRLPVEFTLGDAGLAAALLLVAGLIAAIPAALAYRLPPVEALRS